MLLFPYKFVLDVCRSFVIHPWITVVSGMHVHITKCIGSTVEMAYKSLCDFKAHDSLDPRFVNKEVIEPTQQK